MVLFGTTISGNQSSIVGGGIRNAGDLSLTDVSITENITVIHGGGVDDHGTVSLLGLTSVVLISPDDCFDVPGC